MNMSLVKCVWCDVLSVLVVTLFNAEQLTLELTCWCFRFLLLLHYKFPFFFISVMNSYVNIDFPTNWKNSSIHYENMKASTQYSFAYLDYKLAQKHFAAVRFKARLMHTWFQERAPECDIVEIEFASIFNEFLSLILIECMQRSICFETITADWLIEI